MPDQTYDIVRSEPGRKGTPLAYLVQLESSSSNTVLGVLFSEHTFSLTTIKLAGPLSAAALRFKKATRSSSFK